MRCSASYSRRMLFESGGDGTSKSSVGNPMKMHEPMRVDPKVKNYINLEWGLVYIKEDGVLLLIFSKFEGKGENTVRQDSHIWKTSEC